MLRSLRSRVLGVNITVYLFGLVLNFALLSVMHPKKVARSIKKKVPKEKTHKVRALPRFEHEHAESRHQQGVEHEPGARAGRVQRK